jgi:hypothetical protein
MNCIYEVRCKVTLRVTLYAPKKKLAASVFCHWWESGARENAYYSNRRIAWSVCARPVGRESRGRRSCACFMLVWFHSLEAPESPGHHSLHRFITCSYTNIVK